MIELLVHIRPNVPARKNGQHFEQGRYSRARGPVRFLFNVIQHLLVQELEPQESAHALGQWLFVMHDVRRRLRIDFIGRFGHAGILRHTATTRKSRHLAYGNRGKLDAARGMERIPWR